MNDVIRKLYNARIEEITDSSGRMLKIKLLNEIHETAQRTVSTSTPVGQPPRAPVASKTVNPELVDGGPIPHRYWALKRAGKVDEARALIPGFMPKKLENNTWVLQKRTGGGSSSQYPTTPFESYKYRYALPYPGQQWDDAKQQLKAGGARFRSSKMPDGDDCWYSNDLIGEIRQFIVAPGGVSEAPDVASDFEGYEDDDESIPF